MHKIWVADDDDAIRMVLEESLNSAGFDVTLFCDADSLIENLKTDKPDLVITDIKMPGMDGIDVMNKIKDEKRDIPIILCSAYGQYKQGFRIWASDAYVVKSADLRELRLTIKEIYNQQKTG